MLKLHIGCGNIRLDGWVNVDLESEVADLKHDLREPFPYGDNSVDFIYSEHFIEHLTAQEGLKLLKEIYRVLKPCGVVRIATPNLNYTMFRYFFFWKRQSWFKKFGYEWIKTKAEMINICFREWGHQYLYNHEELERRLREAGFTNIRRQKINKSSYPELQKRETRKESRLILEAVK